MSITRACDYCKKVLAEDRNKRLELLIAETGRVPYPVAIFTVDACDFVCAGAAVNEKLEEYEKKIAAGGGA